MNIVARGRVLAACISATLTAACQSVPTATEVDAILVAPDVGERAELREAVSALLRAPSVVLADDALTRSSTLVIERGAARDGTGARLQGRDYDRPRVVRLVASRGICVLVDTLTGTRRSLELARCRPEQ